MKYVLLYDVVIDKPAKINKIGLILFCCFLPFFFLSQNLINNGGFDIRSRCPSRISQVRMATGWFCSGSPDLFCTCASSRSSVHARLSFVGSLLPNSGDCYAGVIVNARYKEYLTFELPEKLRRNKTYCLKFLYARSIFSGIRARSLGIYLHRQMYDNTALGQPMHNYNKKVAIDDHPGVWTALSFTFTCKGGERFITIGSFENDLEKAVYLPAKLNPKNVRIFNYAKSGYYFIEDVELIKLSTGETCVPLLLPPDTTEEISMIAEVPLEHRDTVVPNSPFVLQELNFETNKSTILRSSFEVLDDMADHLNDQPDLTLLIMGHTDNRGSETMNFDLSLARAEAVAEYLVSKGVNRERLTCKGYGRTRPVSDNSSENGRARNRRVEFQLN